MWRRLLSGGVFWGAAFGDFEAEGLADIELAADERRDELRPVRVLDAPDGAHLVQNLYDAPYMADPRPKIKVGVRFTCAKHTITSWKVAR